ncbi:MAG: GntR family transcriptional regulator [Pseudomonadota bacterium]
MILKNDKEDLEDFAYRYIIHMIVENQVKPGDAILETEMADLLGISRTPVRQALGRLVTEGLLEKKRKKGCVIPLPRPEDAKQVFLAREILEGQVAALAAAHASADDIAGLRLILDRESRALASQDKDGYYLANEEFHFALAKASGNIYFERYCRHIFRRSSFYIFYFDSFYSRRQKEQRLPRQITPRQHAEILAAVERRDPATAEKLVREHIQYSYNVLLGLK